MALRTIAVVGAGGQARDVAWLIRQINHVSETWRFTGYLVSDLSRLGPHDSRDEVLGDLDHLEHHGITCDALALGIGTAAARLRVADEIQRRFPSIELPTLVHPGAIFDRASCKVGPGAIVGAGVVGTV